MVTEQPMRWCARCLAMRPLSLFNRRSRSNQALDSYCKQCRNERRKEWGERPEVAAQLVERARLRLRTARQTVLDHYGSTCACCGESTYEFLSLDHIDGGGSVHRRSLGNRGLGRNFYVWITRQGFPPGYQVLCHNCNQAKGHYGRCPHTALSLSLFLAEDAS